MTELVELARSGRCSRDRSIEVALRSDNCDHHPSEVIDGHICDLVMIVRVDHRLTTLVIHV